MHCLKNGFGWFCMLTLFLLFSACVKNSDVSEKISVISDDDPQLGLWVALHAEKNTIQENETYNVEISFGTLARNLERFKVTVTSNDFEITKTCPDEYVIDGELYSDNDFYAASVSAELPQKFTISLTPKGENSIYAGNVDITITEHIPGGYGSASVTLYYYGNGHLICFSPVSQQEAEHIFNCQKN